MIAGARVALKKIWSGGTGRIGLVLVVVILAVAAFAPWLVTHEPNKLDILHRFAAPSLEHLMGTDQIGRDFFSRIVVGTRLAVGVALTVIAAALILGTLLGIAAAYAGRQVERVILVLFDKIGRAHV